MKLMDFLPASGREMRHRGWDELDVLLITGDAHVDHPAFGAAVIGRVLEAEGFRVGVVSQPDVRDQRSISGMGRPRLFVGITAGSVDSMVARRTAHGKPRKEDRCTPGGRPGLRPDRATLSYAAMARRVFGKVPVVIGGIESSMRRFAHYDFWQDRIRRSFLVDAKADLLIYGMGEQPVVEIARRLASGSGDLTGIAGTCFTARAADARACDGVALPSFEQVAAEPASLLSATRKVEESLSRRVDAPLVQPHGDRWVVAVPPPPPPYGRVLDRIYELPYTRAVHPAQRAHGKVPALETVRWSLTSHRGCFGGCSFCCLGIHQGHRVTSRTGSSLVREARALTRMEGFNGQISDVGGPTANMYRIGCRSDRMNGECRRVSCLYPRICPDLNTDHQALMKLLRSLRAVPGVDRVRVASGIRHDLALQDRRYLAEVCRHHIAGRLRVAPEHAAGKVLRLMRKPEAAIFERFADAFAEQARGSTAHLEMEAYLVSAFPGSGPWERELLPTALQGWGIRTYQVQCFTPTPGTLATAMFYAARDPKGKPLDVVRSARQRKQSTMLAFEPAPEGRNRGRRFSKTGNKKKRKGRDHR